MAEFKEAVAYEKHFLKQKEEGDLLQLIECLSIGQGSRVLDLGCGTGQLTKIIADIVGPTGKASFPYIMALTVCSCTWPVYGVSASFPGSWLIMIMSMYVTMHGCRLQWCMRIRPV